VGIWECHCRFTYRGHLLRECRSAVRYARGTVLPLRAAPGTVKVYNPSGRVYLDAAGIAGSDPIEGVFVAAFGIVADYRIDYRIFQNRSKSAIIGAVVKAACDNQ
jgi:hypothetical protein